MSTSPTIKNIAWYGVSSTYDPLQPSQSSTTPPPLALPTLLTTHPLDRPSRPPHPPPCRRHPKLQYHAAPPPAPQHLRLPPPLRASLLNRPHLPHLPHLRAHQHRRRGRLHKLSPAPRARHHATRTHRRRHRRRRKVLHPLGMGARHRRGEWRDAHAHRAGYVTAEPRGRSEARGA